MKRQKNSMDSLYIVMPAYNEELNIEAVVKQWYPLLEDKAENSKLVIADSGSTDKTHDILVQLKENGYDKIEILSNTNRYHGPKLIALYDYAIKNKVDFIFQTDSDGQTNPDEFDKFWKLREQYVGIFGNRTKRGDGKARSFVAKVLSFLLKIYFGVRIPDANVPYRLMKTETVNKYIYRLNPDYEIPNIMISTYFAYYKERVHFSEISFAPRRAGKNHTNFGMIISVGFRSLLKFATLRNTMK